MGERPVGVPAEAGVLWSRLGLALPEAGEDPATVVEDLAAALEPGLVAIPGPRYFGFVNGGALPAALAADWLVSAFDQNAAMSVMSPAAAAAEQVTAGWLLDLLGLPADAAVGFVTGAQMANFSCLAAARHALLAAVGWDVEADGLQSSPPLTVLVGEFAHTTVLQALRMLGLGAVRARRVPADSHGRMLPGELRRALDETSGPALVCAQAGEVNTGVVDPLAGLAEVVAGHRPAWLHVDGAFGLWAAASPALRPLVDGVGLADSWAVDAHKWLNVPYDCGMAVVRDPSAMAAALTVTAPYLQGDGAWDPFSFTPEASRRARALPVYAALRSLGRQGVADLVERCCNLAKLAAAGLSRIPGVEVLNDVVLNQVLFRVPGDTEAVISHIQRDGTCWLGGTTWRGSPAVRFSVSNWSTTPADIDRSVAAIARAVAARAG
ncbi:MAG TPA: pyridoxal-dependent decarboxylase [Streptosporangiaceae bacterium]|nr:pyridoxal-dependent decarboxylase [Streptosporangiaceae bacterium]